MAVMRLTVFAVIVMLKVIIQHHDVMARVPNGYPGQLNASVVGLFSETRCPVVKNVSTGPNGVEQVEYYLEYNYMTENHVFMIPIYIENEFGQKVLKWDFNKRKIYDHYYDCYDGTGLTFYFCAEDFGGWCFSFGKAMIEYWEESYTTDTAFLSIRIADGIMFPLTFIIGVIGNGLIIIVILKTKSLQSPTNLFLTSMATGDFLMSGILLPIEVFWRHFMLNVDTLPYMLCKVIRAFVELNLCVSSLHVIALSFERYYAICKPMKVALNCTKRRAIGIAVIVWSLSIPYSSMFGLKAFVETSRDLEGNIQYNCIYGDGNPYTLALETARFVTYLILPFCFLLHNYGMVSVVLWKSAKESARMSAGNKQDSGTAQGRIKVMKMLWMMFAAYMLCYTPTVYNSWATTATAWTTHVKVIVMNVRITAILKNFIFFLSAINPIIYIGMSKQIQRAIAKLMPCCRRFLPKPDASSSAASTSSVATGVSQVSTTKASQSVTA